MQFYAIELRVGSSLAAFLFFLLYLIHSLFVFGAFAFCLVPQNCMMLLLQYDKMATTLNVAFAAMTHFAYLDSLLLCFP